jgi:hypothetical protein
MQTIGTNSSESRWCPSPNSSFDQPLEVETLDPKADIDTRRADLGMISHQSSPSKSKAPVSTAQAQAQAQAQYGELLTIITELRNQNASIVSENETLRHELHTLRKEFDAVRSEM